MPARAEEAPRRRPGNGTAVGGRDVGEPLDLRPPIAQALGDPGRARRANRLLEELADLLL
ncbi:hypothetical protein FH608_017620 [Nonomuraea phyllanthi]|uniref:Uncharacterized protein n=1 Tax=Nonomuraea phyllanthi TaxID=2219224 RepID=A0A5C4WJM7_9ACTN|nr:hypothetical protein [Nonomuraea phyllanthi]KAB8194012.1 hypothetical protein FH608_017620 [Nonomuraea phyllanthi]QFY07612.1 hypothetical protein GBF35_13785 [Nonomuraea phyllanthi]